MTPDEIEVHASEFLDNLPLELTRGQAAMLYVRLMKFAEAMQPKKPERKRKPGGWGAEAIARLRSDPVRLAVARERMARAIAARAAKRAAAKAA